MGVRFIFCESHRIITAREAAGKGAGAALEDRFV